MKVKFTKSGWPALQLMTSDYLTRLSSPIDSFLEDHIVASTHYGIWLGMEEVGYCSIHQTNLVTQYYLLDQYKSYGQAIFQQIKRLESVQAAFVPTADEFFLAHALDEYKQIEKQAYFFQMPKALIDLPLAAGVDGRLAQLEDSAFIKANTGDFFGDLAGEVQRGEIYLIDQGQFCVGFGVLVKSKLFPNWASIGMYTIEKFRNQGIGRQIIHYLLNKCHQQGLTAIAGCWYYNHLSKKTLESAGMYTQTRLLKIGY
ncbi:hypothetical protein BH10CHL1_BH10CHL1_27540 [soil metagenome]